MAWKNKITKMSDGIFPGILDHTEVQDKIIMSNLPLQMALYFNVVYAPFWISILIMYLDKKLIYFLDPHKFLILTIICIAIPVEILRLYFGLEGNLKDKVPELAGFWMLSIFLQFPTQAVLLFTPYLHFSVLEIISQVIMLTMLAIQTTFGYVALKYTADQQAKQFKRNKLKLGFIQGQTVEGVAN